MKRTSLVAAIVGFAAIAALPPEASAYYHAQMGRFINRDPIGYEGGDRNLYRYVGNRSVSAVDPFGKQAGGGIMVPPTPLPAPGMAGTNAQRLLGMGYFFTSYCSAFRSHNTPFAGFGSATVTPARGPDGHAYEASAYPAVPPGPIGGGGSQTCIILVVKCTGVVVVFHFSVGDSPLNTVHAFSWPAGCSAFVCGGSCSPQSRCLADDVVARAKAAFSSVEVAIGQSTCGVNATGGWYAKNYP